MSPKFEILKNSPVYAMSLGSHELFHSNFWAWMMEAYKKSIKDVFGIDVGDKTDIKREYKHFDISIIGNNGIYVIENKFKSIPYKEQLIAYKQAVENDNKAFEGGILACLEKPAFEVKGWKCLTYAEILKSMKYFAEKNINDKLHRAIVEEYILVTETMLEIIGNVNKSVSRLQLSSKCFTKCSIESEGIDLEELRLSDILRKLNAVKFLREQEERIKNETGKEFLYIDSDYSRKDAILNFFLVKPKNDTNGLFEAVKKAEYDHIVGIQIQGNAYRRICFFTGKEKKEMKQIFEELQNLEWFSTKSDGRIFDRKTGMKDDYCSFSGSGGKYNAVYQYYNIDERNGFDDVAEDIIKDLKKAKEIFEKL